MIVMILMTIMLMLVMMLMTMMLMNVMMLMKIRLVNVMVFMVIVTLMTGQLTSEADDCDDFDENDAGPALLVNVMMLMMTGLLTS